jgi:hypothetical protein
MKATIEFDLPEEIDDYKIYNMAREMHSMIWDFSQHMRSESKWNESLTDDQDKYLDVLREKFYDLVNEYNIDLDL